MYVAVFSPLHQKYLDLYGNYFSEFPILYKYSKFGRIDLLDIFLKSGDFFEFNNEMIEIIIRKNVFTSFQLIHKCDGIVTPKIISDISKSFKDYILLLNLECKIGEIIFNGKHFQCLNFITWDISPYILGKWIESVAEDDNFVSVKIQFLENDSYSVNLDENEDEIATLYSICDNTSIIHAIKNSDIDFIDEDGNNLFLLAIKYQQKNLAKILIDDVNLEHKNKNDDDALKLALFNPDFWKSNFSFSLCEEIFLRTEEITEIHLSMVASKELDFFDDMLQCFESFSEFEDLILCTVIFSAECSRKIILKQFRFEDDYDDYISRNFKNVTHKFYLFCKYGDRSAINLINAIDLQDLRTGPYLFYACLNNMPELAFELLEKDIDLSIQYYGKRIEFYSRNPEISGKILEKMSCVLFSDNFSIIHPGSYTVVRNITEGAYGKIRQISLRKNQKHLILKESKDCKSEGYISEDVIKEIFFLRKINSSFPDSCGKIYGVLANEQCLDIAMEFEGLSLDNYALRLTEIERKEQFVSIFRQVLECTANLHCLGIIHYDISAKNIVVKQGKVKLIDLGISKYYEIFPFKRNVKVSFQYIPWISMDNWKKNIVTNGEISVSAENFKGLNYTSDVFSIGVVMCQYIYKTFNLGFYFDDYDRLIYRSLDIANFVGDKHNISSTKNTIDKNIHTVKNIKPAFLDMEILLSYPDVFPLLKYMLTMNSEKRFIPRMILNLPPFGERYNVRIGKLPLQWEKNSDITHSLLRTKRYDFDQIDSMINMYKNETVKVFNNARIDVIESLIQHNRGSHYKAEISDNSIFNCIFATMRYDDFPALSASYVEKFWLTFYRCIFECIELTDKFKQMIPQITTKDITFTPVSLYVSYIALNLELEGKPYIHVFGKIYEELIYFLSAVKNDFNVWNVISVIAKDLHELENYDLRNEETILNTIDEGRNILSNFKDGFYMDKLDQITI